MRRLSNILWCPGRAADARRSTASQPSRCSRPSRRARELALAYANLSFLERHVARSRRGREVERTSRCSRERARRRRQVAPEPSALRETTSVPWSSPGGRGLDGRSSQTASLRLAANAPLATRDYARGSPVHRSRRRPLRPARTTTSCSATSSPSRRGPQLDRGRWDRADGLRCAGAPCYGRSPRCPASCRSSCSRSCALAGATRTRSRCSGRRLELAEQSGELLRIAPVATARAEVAWLTGKLDEIAHCHGGCARARDGEAVGRRSRAS